MNKDQLRQQLQQRRAELGEAYRRQASEEVCKQLITLAEGAERIHTYQPIQSKSELDITEFNQWAQEVGKDVYIQDWSGDFPSQQFDLVIVPGLGFDEQGNRLGYGGGNYDRFLSEQTGTHSVGVCFTEQKMKKIPTELHDIAVGDVVSN